jgi:hypothetical protein
VPRTRRCSMSRKRKITEKGSADVTPTVHRSHPTYQHDRRGNKRTHTRRRQSGYPNQGGVKQQSTKEVRRQDKTGGPTKLLVRTHGPAERKCRRMIDGAGVWLPNVGGGAKRWISTFPKFVMTGVDDGPTEMFARTHEPAERKCEKNRCSSV